MGGDLVVALGSATANGHTLFGQNCHRPSRECQVLHHLPGRTFAPGEMAAAPYAEVPQVRRTWAVLGCQPQGAWGCTFGVNEHQVAAGCTAWRSRLARERPGLAGPDLVRLGLERAASARQAVDVLTDLVGRHGQADGDHTFLVADPAEAFAIEAAGAAWAVQEIGQVRAASDVGVIRQDWDRLAPGLADDAIGRGWWPADGSKLDFVGTLGGDPARRGPALRRWGRATLLLEQQNGHIDVPFLRRLLADHFDGTPHEIGLLDPAPVTPLCQHGGPPARLTTAASLVVDLSAAPDHVPVVWCAFGPPCQAAYFPVLLDGDLPSAYTVGGVLVNPDSLWWRAYQLADSVGRDERRRAAVRDAVEELQIRFDRDAEEFAAEAGALRRQAAGAARRRLAESLLQNHLERFEEMVQELLGASQRTAVLARPDDR
ncbi:MAG: C69 family dipeptidase [Gemmataceae bacterium]|nr:C69 family dipeptidase [Gemmataceae bacterium]